MSTEIIRIRCVPEIDKDAHGTYTAVCTELGLAAMGETEEQARSDLKTAIMSYCYALRRRSLLDKALAESGISHEQLTVDLSPGEVLVNVTP